MHEFKYKQDDFYCEQVKVEDISRRFGTPVYIYSHKTLKDHFNKIKNAFKAFKPLICFSMKSNSNLTLLKVLTKEGAGLDIVSGGELYRALKIKADPKKIVYASVGKTELEIRDAISAGILFFNVESLPELEFINKIAGHLKRKVKVAIRLNPDINPKTHSYITTSKKENKFGLDFNAAASIFSQSKKFKNLSIEGLHLHIGSQITTAKPYKEALLKVIKFIKDEKIEVKYLNIGGGLGIVYSKEKPQTAESFAEEIAPLIKSLKVKLILEPGRFIAGNSGVMVTKVLYIKEAAGKIFVIVDAGMNDLLRPSLYGAYHTIVPHKNIVSSFKKPVDIVGPICESGDFLAKDRHFKKVEKDDYLIVLGAGAYGYTMTSNYNTRPRPAEVLIKGNKSYLIRRRETYKDLISKELMISGV